MNKDQIRIWRRGFQTLFDGSIDLQTNIRAIIDLAEGTPLTESLMTLKLVKSLIDRGLAEYHVSSYDASIGMFLDPTDTVTGFRLTEYGMEFAGWLMEPRDTLINLDLPIDDI